MSDRPEELPPPAPPADPAPAPPPLDDDPLPAHRVALRAAVSAPPAALMTVLVAVLLVVVVDGPPPQPGFLVGFVLLTTLGLSAWWGLLLITEQAAARIPARRLRPAAIALVGCGATLLASCVVVWAQAIFDGRGAEGALAELARLFDDLARRPGKTAQLGLITLAPFVVLGGARAALPGARRPLPTALLAAAGGLLAAGIGCAFEGLPRRGEDLLVGLGLCGAAPFAGGFVLARAERLEARLLGVWARWRDRDRDG